MTTLDLFAGAAPSENRTFAPGAQLMPGAALAETPALLVVIAEVAARAPFRTMVTRRGLRMRAELTACGRWGWISDRAGYRYVERDPETGAAWPAMPEVVQSLAARAAQAAGFANFAPDSCLINRYPHGAGMGLHQDINERDFSQPIVSVSLGLPTTFWFGGAAKTDPRLKLVLRHGDVVVWGGPSRRWFHGVAPVKPDVHPLTGPFRLNLTIRQAA